jgi:SnoaL-like domain
MITTRPTLQLGGTMNRNAALGVLLAAATLAPAAHAQTAAPAVRDSVIAVVERFFTAMAERDTAAVSAVFLPDAGSAIVQHMGDSSVVATAPISSFRTQLPQMTRTLLERMWDAQVLEHRGLAVLWTPYDFHVDETFSHCGVDAFTLVRTREGWKISGVAYTVETTGCPPSPLGPP